MNNLLLNVVSVNQPNLSSLKVSSRNIWKRVFIKILKSKERVNNALSSVKNAISLLNQRNNSQDI